MNTASEFRPLVSIIIPVYNGSNFLAEAIDSALAQTYDNKEIIVVNDGSCDDGETERIALSYGDKIRYFKKENGGVSSALNLGIEKMQGEYFSWLSHDDLYLPCKVADQVAALDGKNDAVLLSGTYQIDVNGERLKHQNRGKAMSPGRHAWHDALKCLLAAGSFNGCAFLVPKRAFEICGGFDESMKYLQDALMWTNIFLNHFDLIVLDKPGACSRVHGNQLTQTGRALFHKESEMMAKIVLPALLQASEHASDLVYIFAYHNAVMNNPHVVRDCLRIGKKEGIISLSQRAKVRMICIYGKIRPTIRKIYYRVFRKMKTT